MALGPLIAYDDDPVNNTIHHPYTAFNQGWDAADTGFMLAENPYDVGRREWRNWLQGWLDAVKDRR